MKEREYLALRDVERQHWWFRSMQLFLWRLILVRAASSQKTLDLGCGTGGLLLALHERGFETTGMDVSEFALLLVATDKHPIALVQADANNIPFATSFELIISVDLLEVGSVIPEQVVHNACRALKPGGIGVFAAAAHQWLMSEHDRAVNSVRRFTLREMDELFEKANVRVIRKTYLFYLLFPTMVIRKLFNPPRKHSSAVSDVRMPNKFLNGLLYGICSFEARLLSLFDLPMGSTAVVVVQKNG